MGKSDKHPVKEQAPTEHAFDEEIEGEDRDALIAHGLALFRLAADVTRQRLALWYWLRGATLAANEVQRPSGLDAPGDLLVAAIEALSLGSTHPIMKPMKRRDQGPRRDSGSARAKIRALVAATLLAAVCDIGTRQAVRIVCSLNGMKPRALKKMIGDPRKAEDSRYARAQRKYWVAQDDLAASIGLERGGFVIDLVKDRSILR